MNPLPSVSVILPVKNGARYLAESLRSVREQEHRACEVLVLDDESTDETEAIARGFSSDGVRYICNRPSLGVAGSCNLGIELARGELLAFTSHDDIWLPQKLRVQAALFVARPELDYCIALVRTFLDRAVNTAPKGFKLALIGQDVPGYVLETLIVRRLAFDRAGVFDPALRQACDTDWYARARSRGLVGEMIDEALVHRRLHATNATYDPERVSHLHRELLGVAKRSLQVKKQG